IRVGQSPSPLQNYSLRLSMPIESTGGAVLTVPRSALYLTADGKSRIQVQNSGELKYVAVEPGLAADGFVEIKAIDGKLEAGQLVVVGSEKPENTENPQKQS